jgi:hypothetical protein
MVRKPGVTSQDCLSAWFDPGVRERILVGGIRAEE